MSDTTDTDTDPPDCRQLFGDIIAIVTLANTAVPSAEPLFAILPGDRISVAAGPAPHETLMASAYVDLIDGPVCVLTSNTDGEVTTLYCVPGPWIAAVAECARQMRGGYVPEAGWFARTSMSVH